MAVTLFGERFNGSQIKAQEDKRGDKPGKGLVDLSTEQNFSQPQVQIIADREACARYGVSVNEILEVVELAIGGELLMSF